MMKLPDTVFNQRGSKVWLYMRVLWLDETQLLCSSSELQQKAGPTAYLGTAAWMPPRTLLWLTYMLKQKKTKKKKERERSSAGLSVQKSDWRCGACSWESDITNICHRRIVQENNETDEKQMSRISSHVS